MAFKDNSTVCSSCCFACVLVLVFRLHDQAAVLHVLFISANLPLSGNGKVPAVQSYCNYYVYSIVASAFTVLAPLPSQRSIHALKPC